MNKNFCIYKIKLLFTLTTTSMNFDISEQCYLLYTFHFSLIYLCLVQCSVVQCIELQCNTL